MSVPIKSMKNFVLNSTKIENFNFDFPECGCELTETEYSTLYRFINFSFIIILLPLTAIFGAIFNFVNVFIFTQKEILEISGNVYLAALATSDIFVDLTGIVTITIDSLKVYMPSLANSRHLTIFILPLGYRNPPENFSKFQFFSKFFQISKLFQIFSNFKFFQIFQISNKNFFK